MITRYAVHTRHDKGEITIHVSATDKEKAIELVMAAERCPRCSILWVKIEAQIQEEKMTITVEEMVGREVIYCVSSLISDLVTLADHAGQIMANETSLDPDELMNLQQVPDYEAAADGHIDDMVRDDLISALEDADVEDERDPADKAAAAVEEYNKGLATGDIDPGEDSLEDWCRDQLDQWPGISDDVLRPLLKEHLGDSDGYKDFVEANNVDYDYTEVYEHWIVSNWLAGKLRARGQVVADIANMIIWGRTCTGQAISMDWVIQDIHRELVAK